ncbi:MAG: glycine cleavage system protein GcvH [Hydrocarboniphaga effusa]|nr:glycine cleavage system protein GcvH [Hydrocarboniphaga effusa]
MSKVPNDLRYAKSHEWAKKQPDGTVLIGITDHAQAALGDLVFVEVPKVGRQIKAGEACAVVESVKAASDVYAPVSGEVVEANPDLANAPETLNQDPYGKGWMFKLKPSSAAELDQLLDAAAYQKEIADAH